MSCQGWARLAKALVLRQLRFDRRGARAGEPEQRHERQQDQPDDQRRATRVMDQGEFLSATVRSMSMRLCRDSSVVG